MNAHFHSLDHKTSRIVGARRNMVWLTVLGVVGLALMGLEVFIIHFNPDMNHQPLIKNMQFWVDAGAIYALMWMAFISQRIMPLLLLIAYTGWVGYVGYQQKHFPLSPSAGYQLYYKAKIYFHPPEEVEIPQSMMLLAPVKPAE